MCASNSVLARGCLKDGALVDGEEVMMDTSYVTSLVAWFTSRPSTEVFMYLFYLFIYLFIYLFLLFFLFID